jgi:hypothetical protein
MKQDIGVPSFYGMRRPIAAYLDKNQAGSRHVEDLHVPNRRAVWWFQAGGWDH